MWLPVTVFVATIAGRILLPNSLIHVICRDCSSDNGQKPRPTTKAKAVANVLSLPPLYTTKPSRKSAGKVD